MGFRPTPWLRKKIEAAAKANGRSMSQEIEVRLELSFAREQWERAPRIPVLVIDRIEARLERIFAKVITA